MNRWRTWWSADRRRLAILVPLVFLLAVGALIVALDDRQPSDPSRLPPATATAAVVASSPLPSPPPPAASSTATSPPTATLLPRVACADACLVRLPDDRQTRRALDRHGLRPAYLSGGQLWADASSDAIGDLRHRGIGVAMVADEPETLPLYPVRISDGADDRLARGAGEVLDRVGNQLLLRVDGPPPTAELVAARFAIEKFPPLPPPLPADSADLPLLADPGDLYPAVSVAEIERTIVELQATSSTDGTGVGTRSFGTTGNLMEAEYIAQRFGGYGLDRLVRRLHRR